MYHYFVNYLFNPSTCYLFKSDKDHIKISDLKQFLREKNITFTKIVNKHHVEYKDDHIINNGVGYENIYYI